MTDDDNMDSLLGPGVFELRRRYGTLRNVGQKAIDFEEIRRAIMELLRNRPMTTSELCVALDGRFSKDATYRCIRYARDDKYIYREKHNQPWQIRK